MPIIPNKTRKEIEFFWNLYIRRQEPIIIYSMGKVGSKSITKSLKNHGFKFVISTHRLSQEHINKIRNEYLANQKSPPKEVLSKEINKHLLSKNKSVKFIAMVRDPIERNISAFFNNRFKLEEIRNLEVSDSNEKIQALINQFIEEYEHDTPLMWFEREIKPVLDIDIYDHPFPTETGYQEISKDPYKLLLIKSELDDREKNLAIRQFLNLEDFELFRDNVAAKKKYANAYKKFKETIVLSPDYINEMCDNRYVKHFYSDTEIAVIRNKWCSASS